MKHLIILMLLAAPLTAFAQNWETLETAKPKTEQKDSKKAKKDDKKKDDASQQQASKTKEVKMKIDKKYATGAVPLVDGKVEWTTTISVPGVPANVLFDKMITFLTNMTKEPQQTELSRISAVNRQENMIAAHFEENLTFKSSALAVDETLFKYNLIVTCKNGELIVTMKNLSYAYDLQRDGGRYTAEEWITDEAALNKKGTNVYRLNGKFRIKTIDRKDVIFSNIEYDMKR